MLVKSARWISGSRNSIISSVFVGSEVRRSVPRIINPHSVSDSVRAPLKKVEKEEKRTTVPGSVIPH